MLVGIIWVGMIIAIMVNPNLTWEEKEPRVILVPPFTIFSSYLLFSIVTGFFTS